MESAWPDDVDEDGIPNYLDDDSDGDGILDADESGDEDCDDVEDVIDVDHLDGPCGDGKGGADDGCGCSATTAAPWPWAFTLVVFGLVLARRRRVA